MNTVAYSCAFVPCEWIAAHGLRPWRLCPPAAASSFLGAAEGVCPYARAFIAAAAAGEFDAVVVTTLCDQMRRASELIQRLVKKPVLLMNVPSTWERPEAFDLYLAELKRLGAFLARLGGKPPTDEHLANIILEFDRRRTCVRAAATDLSARQRTLAYLQITRGERVPIPTGRDHSVQRSTPLALVGGELREGDLAVLDLIEQGAGRIVLNATDMGERVMPAPLNRRQVESSPLEELARAYFAIPHVFRRPNGALYEYLGKELAARGVRAVIFRRMPWCDLWNAELGRMKEALPVPVLSLDIGGDGEDLSHRAGRLAALLEVVR